MSGHPPIVIGQHVLPQRRVDTPDGPMWVPRHVYRKHGGWQIFLNRTTDHYYEYFGDSAYGSQHIAFDRTMEKLYDEMPHHKLHDQLNPGSSLYYQVREFLPSHTSVMVTHVQTYICAYRSRLRSITFYVGTENTRSDLRLRTAIDRAIGTRCWSIDTITSEGRDVLFELPVPRAVEKYAY